MNEADARAVRRMQALESRDPDGSSWGADDRLRASEAARRTVGAAATSEAFTVARARAIGEQLAARGERASRSRLAGSGLPLLVIALALIAGIAANFAGPGQRIDLLSPPWLAVVAWNLLTYGALLVLALRPRSALRDPLRRLDAQRLKRMLHLGALTLALGLCIGLYARGLVLDYRAGWQSTFLDAAQVHALLAVVLAPASALSGLKVPDVDTIAALRIGPAGTSATSASAATWIHLFALTLLLVVIVPRALLALTASWRVRQLAGNVPLDVSAPYFQRLARECANPHAAVPVTVIPYAVDLDATAQPALLAALESAMGGPVRLELAPSLAFGSEDSFALAAPIAAAGSTVFLLFALAATPEHEHHGALLSHIAGKLAPARMHGVLVDESGFRLRFAADPQRTEQRRAAWQALLAGHGLTPRFIDLTPAADLKVRA